MASKLGAYETVTGIIKLALEKLETTDSLVKYKHLQINLNFGKYSFRLNFSGDQTRSDRLE